MGKHGEITAGGRLAQLEGGRPADLQKIGLDMAGFRFSVYQCCLSCLSHGSTLVISPKICKFGIALLVRVWCCF